MIPKVSQLLLAARQKKRIDLEKASADLRIQIKFLRALETADFKIFSTAVQTEGFLKNYARYLGLAPEEVLAFYRRDLVPDFFAKSLLKSAPGRRNLVTPERFTFFSLLVLLIIFALYLFGQYRSFWQAPPLTVEVPKGDVQIKDLQVTIRGRTCPDCQVSLNDQKVNVSPEGKFVTSLSLRDGVNQLTVVAQSRAGRETTVTRTVTVLK